MSKESASKTIRHSPAPFTAAGPYTVLDADRNSIASFSGPHKAGNQALFAASPDLLEACRLALFLARTKAPWTEEQIGEVEAAIAKTRLREQRQEAPIQRETVNRLAPGVKYILVRGHALPLSAVRYSYTTRPDCIVWGGDLYDVFERGADV